MNNVAVSKKWHLVNTFCKSKIVGNNGELKTPHMNLVHGHPTLPVKQGKNFLGVHEVGAKDRV